MKLLFKIFGLFSWIISACLLVSPVSAKTGELILGIHPYLPALELEKRFSPLADYLSKNLGTRVTIKVSPSYIEHIQRVARGEVDIAYLGPVPLVRAYKINPDLKLLARLEVDGKPVFSGKIVTHDNSGIDNLQQLKSKKFAFGSKSSTMSHLVPRYELIQAGVFEQLAGFKHLKGHKSVAIAVMLGKYDAGAVKEEVFNLYKDQGMKLIHTTQPISEHVFVASEQLPEAKIKLIRESLLSIKQAESGLGVIQSIKPDVTNLVPVNFSDYNNLKVLLDELGDI